MRFRLSMVPLSAYTDCYRTTTCYSSQRERAGAQTFAQSVSRYAIRICDKTDRCAASLLREFELLSNIVKCYKEYKQSLCFDTDLKKYIVYIALERTIKNHTEK